MTTKKLRKGDKVICIHPSNEYRGTTDTVICVPGNKEYDENKFGYAKDGIVLKNNSWCWRKDWEKVEK
jgi:hypothetical protein